MITPEILTRFKGVTGSYGHYMAKCPCHKDNKASLSITAKKGVTLIHCFAGMLGRRHIRESRPNI